MINFFRKTRKQLADDNKPLKYMRYAIGEIVLVVIGILIALSIFPIKFVQTIVYMYFPLLTKLFYYENY